MKNLKSDFYSQFPSKKYLFMGSLVFLFIITSCSVKLYEPSAETVSTNANLTKLKQGKELYINKCAECHSLKQPEKYSADKWVKLVKVMSKKAKINDDQASLILQYVTKGERS